MTTTVFWHTCTGCEWTGEQSPEINADGRHVNPAGGTCGEAITATPVKPECCPRCEGDGSYSELADCTTLDKDCACNFSRVLIDPCPKCDGTGVALPLPRQEVPKEDR